MAIEIVKVYKEQFPSLRLIGKKYFDKDRVNGGFYHKWGEWFQNGWFGELEKINQNPKNNDAYLGFMRTVDGVSEYFIGMFFDENTTVPIDFEYIDLEAFEVATCFVYGNEKSGEFYSADVYDVCASEASKNNLICKNDGFCFERYNLQRFTTPDELGNVILDYCIQVD